MADQLTNISEATPSLGLSASTIQAVKDAGVEATYKDRKGRTVNVKDSLRQGKMLGDIGKQVQKGLGGAADKIEDAKQKREEFREGQLEKWDEGFDEMELRGSWANNDLYDVFAGIEKTAKKDFENAVKEGDKTKQGELLKSQAERSNQLKAFKEAMESAKKINDNIGWSVALKGDNESREVLMEMSKMGPKVAQTAKFDEKGILTFEIPVGSGKRYNASQIDKMVADGTKPIQKELDYLTGLQNYQTMGAEGKPFNDEQVTKQNMLALGNDDQLATYAFEDFGGGGSFAQHIKTAPDMLKAFEGLEYKEDMNSNTLKDAMDDGTITADEYATFSDDDMKKIIGQMKSDDLRRELANYQMLQQKKNWQSGVDAKQGASVMRGKQATYNGLSAEQKKAYAASFATEEEFFRAIGLLD
tara:strand:- start:307 stop:1554 length:1248 start_codon:yes stop_codon:yes gene_type:complete